MSRRLVPHRAALADQALAIVRSAEGFPISTGEIARQLGGRLVAGPKPSLPPRPACWPDDLTDPENRAQSLCHRCHGFHREPVWRSYQAEDIRSLLVRLADRGEIERIVPEGARAHYWRGATA